MRLLHHLHFFRFPHLLDKTHSGWKVFRYKNFRSKFLHRKVVLDLYLPPSFNKFPRKCYPTLFFNDGQDMKELHLLETLDNLGSQQLIGEVIVVAVHAHNRLQEYGTASQLNFLNHGGKAQAFTDFIVYELMPFIRFKYRSLDNPSFTSIAGCSLGGLSAMDIAWSHPDHFGKIGVFSGSFWWRSKAYETGYQDTDRIMHSIIREGTKKPGMKFWFQAGALDETADRNNSGTIDAVEDTLDLVNELNNKGYRNGTDIVYRKVEGGKHDLSTWAAVLPEFLQWACGTNKVSG